MSQSQGAAGSGRGTVPPGGSETVGRAVLPDDRSAFAALFSQSPDGVILTDREGRILAANPAACTMLRAAEGDLAQAGIADLTDPAEEDPGWKSYLAAEDGSASSFDIRLFRSDGSHFIAAVSRAAVGDGRSWLLVRDVTERSRTEQALQSLSDLTTDLLDGAPLAELMMSTAAAARRMFGAAAAWVSAASDDGESILILAQDSDSADLPDFTGRRFPIRSVLAGRIAVAEEAVLIEDMSSEDSAASAIGRSLRLGPALGVPLGHGERYFGSLVVAARRGHPQFSLDEVATARRLARSAAVALGLAYVQGELSELAALVEEGPDPMLLTGSSGRVLSANRAARDIFGIIGDALQPGAPPPQVLEEFAAERPSDSDDDRALRGDVTYRRPDGALCIGNVASVTRSGPLGETRRWTVIRDVTERRRMEESLRAVTDVTMALLAREPIEEILARCASHARRLVDGTAGYAVTAPAGDQPMMTVAEDSPPACSMRGRAVPHSGTVLAEVMASGTSLIVEDLSADPGWAGMSPLLGSALVVPLQHGGRCLGVLLVAAERGRPAYGRADVGVVEMFAHSAALALDLSEARATLALVEERERLAKELHDRVIQHLFGIGLGLQAAIGRPAEQMTAGIARSVEALDRIISEIRSTIFDLKAAS